MNILQLVSNLEVGGLERIVVSLGQGLVARGHTVSLGALTHDGPLASQMPCSSRWIGGVEQRGRLYYVSRLLSLRRFVRQHRIDVVHCHNLRAAIFWARSGLFRGTPPAVYTTHGRGINGEDIFPRQVQSAFRAVVAVSEDAAKVVRQSSPRCPVQVILNGVDAVSQPATDQMRREQTRARVGIPLDAWVIGSAGRFSAEKDYALLIEAFAILVEQTGGMIAGRPVYCVLVGDGPERGLIEAKIDALGVAGSVVLVGMQSEMPAWYRIMDLFCLCSLTEGTPITLLEAMSEGVVCMATPVGGIPAVLDHGRAGFLTDNRKSTTIASAICTLLSDQALSRRLESHALSRVRMVYSCASMVDCYEAVYRNVLAVPAAEQAEIRRGTC